MFQNYSFHFNSTKIFIIFSNFFVSRHHINTSIFFSPLHPTATTIDTSSPPRPPPYDHHDLLPRNPALHPPRERARSGRPSQYVNTRSEKFASSQSPAIISLSSGVQ